MLDVETHISLNECSFFIIFHEPMFYRTLNRSLPAMFSAINLAQL